jgi:hypothetical protein
MRRNASACLERIVVDGRRGRGERKYADDKKWQSGSSSKPRAREPGYRVISLAGCCARVHIVGIPHPVCMSHRYIIQWADSVKVFLLLFFALLPKYFIRVLYILVYMYIFNIYVHTMCKYTYIHRYLYRYIRCIFHSSIQYSVCDDCKWLMQTGCRLILY